MQGLFTKLLGRVRYRHAGSASGCCARSSWHGRSYRMHRCCAREHVHGLVRRITICVYVGIACFTFIGPTRLRCLHI